MRKRFLTALFAVMLIAALGVISASAEGTTVTVTADALQSGVKSAIEFAVEQAGDGGTVLLPEGTFTGSTEEITVGKKEIAIKGAEDGKTALNNVTFSVISSEGEGGKENGNPTNVQETKVTFSNLAFTGTSQIKLGHIQPQNFVYDYPVTTHVKVDNCEFNVEGQPFNTGTGTSYNMDLSITNSKFLNESSLFGPYAQIISLEIKDNTIGTEENRLSGNVVKMSRRQHNTTISVTGNNIYADVTKYDFNVFELWQSGTNPYNSLEINVENNKIDGEGSGNVYAAEVEDTVRSTT